MRATAGTSSRRRTVATGDKPFKVEREEVLFDWLAHESDPDRRELMLEWFASLVHDPGCSGQATRVPGITAPVYLVVTPVPPYILKYLVAWQFFTIRLIEFDTLP